MSNRTLLQIDSCLGIASTGRITESIGALVNDKGWECYIAHGARYVGNSGLKSIPVGTKCSEYLHYAKSLLLDNHGLNSTCETRRLIEKIKEIKPDIIQLHCIHGYYLNYKVLFDYLNTTDIPLVWTFHDCWAFTGHCAHFVSVGCGRWKTTCNDCPLKNDYPASIGLDRSKRNFELKKKLFLKIKNLTIVTVSNWLESLVKESFFKDMKSVTIQTMYNGVDIEVFKPYASKFNIKDKYSLGNDFILLACATAWSDSKGLIDYIELSKLLPNGFKLILVGVSNKLMKTLPSKVLAIGRTDSVKDLAELYSAADIVLNLSHAETFGLTTAEGFACGTPCIAYDATASPELITSDTGLICPEGDINAVYKAIMEIKNKGKAFYSMNCRNRATIYFNKTKQFGEYVNLYEQILNNQNK